MNSSFEKEDLKQEIEKADCILIGFGEAFTRNDFFTEQADRALEQGNTRWLADFFLAEELLTIQEDAEIIQAYRLLGSWLKHKNVFLITSNYDDLIKQTGIYEGLMVRPGGSIGTLTCGHHVVDGTKIIGEICRKALMTDSFADVIRPVCPECGHTLHFYVVGEPGYSEKGYEEQWKSYQNWLSGTLGKKLLLLEMGVGEEWPDLIARPFERICMVNQKAKLIRVHSRKAQTKMPLNERCLEIVDDPIEFLTR